MEEQDKFLTNESWCPGEWINKPDIYAIGESEHKGYKLIIKHGGSWCDYVVIKSTEDLEEEILIYFDDREGKERTWIMTYFENYLPSERKKTKYRYYIGFDCAFDCAHAHDFMPRLAGLISPEEWLNEPDLFAIIELEHKGYKGILKRSYVGSWCGCYVEIKGRENIKEEMFENIDVHGGVTYFGNALPDKTKEAQNTYYVGFDCAHYNDIAPRFERMNNEFEKNFPDKYQYIPGVFSYLKNFNHRSYRTLQYAREELINLIDQVDEILGKQ